MPNSYKPDDIKKMLFGYSLVHAINYKNISKNTHVRYFKNDGKFVRGGFVLNYWSRNEVDFIHLGNNLNSSSSGYKAWPVALTNIKAIYAKNNTDTESIKSLNDSLSKQKNIILSINKIIKKLANHDKRLVNIEVSINKMIKLIKNKK